MFLTFEIWDSKGTYILYCEISSDENSSKACLLKDGPAESSPWWLGMHFITELYSCINKCELGWGPGCVTVAEWYI